MTITFYNISSEHNKIDKTAELGTGTQYTGSIRDTSCSVEHPIITIKSDTYPDYNYAYISDFDRYYFVVAKSVLVTGLYSFELDEDVLMSFKGNRNAPRTGIFALSGYCSRYEFGNYDTSPVLSDRAYPILSESSLTKYTPSGATPWMSSDSFLSPTAASNYLILFQGYAKNNNTGEIMSNYPMGSVALTGANLPYFVKQLSDYDFTDLLSVNRFTDFLYKIAWYPFSLYESPSVTVNKLVSPGILSQDLDLGAHDGVKPNITRNTEVWTINVSAPGSGYNGFMCYEPYTKISLSFLPFGVFTLDSSYLFNSPISAVTVYITVKTDILTGQSVLYYGKNSTDKIYLGTANVCITVPYSSVQYGNLINGLATVGGAVGGVVSGVSGGDIIPALSAVSTGLNAFSPNAQAKSGTFNHIDAFPTIFVQTHSISGEMASEIGRPYGKSVIVGTLGGFAKFDQIDVHGTGLENANANEIERIERALKEGVFI